MNILRSKYFPIILFLIILVLSFVLLSFLGLVPEQLKFGFQDTNTSKLVEKEDGNSVENLYPSRIVVSSVGIDTSVSNPSSKIVADLDEELKKGAVRYPGSGTLGKGNMLLFGHSTGFKTVLNQSYKAFNNLNKVKIGDEIKVYGDGEIYVYIVKKVEEVKDSDAQIIFNTTTAGLTLSTCDSFGAKEDRFLVEADFKEVFSKTE